MASGLNGAAEERFWSSVTRTAAPQPIKILKDNIVTAGRGVGRIFGGNLSLVAALSGTPFFPLLSDPILLLEEVGERPYRIDRMLRTLLLAGGRRRTRAVVLGRFDDCLPEARRPSLSVRQVIGETFQSSSFPVVGGLSYGHSSDSLTMPIGIRARVDTAGQSLEFLEGGVC
jgi:muramoyltetrapeptide carboxypeptidase